MPPRRRAAKPDLKQNVRLLPAIDFSKLLTRNILFRQCRFRGKNSSILSEYFSSILPQATTITRAEAHAGLKSHHAARFLSRTIERSRKRSQSSTASRRYRTRQLGERRPDPLASPAFAAFAQSIQARRPGRLRRCSRQAQSLCWGLRNGKSRPSQGRLLIKNPPGGRVVADTLVAALPFNMIRRPLSISREISVRHRGLTRGG